MAQIWSSIIQTGGARTYSILAQFVIVAISARWLGAEGRGIYAAVVTWMALFATAGHLSLGQVTLHRAATAPDRKWLSSTLGTLIAYAVAVSLLGAALATALYWQSAGHIFAGIPFGTLAIGFVLIPFLLWEQFGSALLMAIDRLRTYNLGQIIGRSTGIAGLLVLVVWLPFGVVGALFAAVLAQAATSTFGLRSLFNAAESRPLPDRKTLRGLVTGGLRLHPNALGTFLISGVDILMVTYYCGVEQAAFYQLAVHLKVVLLTPAMAASQVMFSRVSVVGPDEAWPSQRRVLSMMVPGMVALAAVAALIAPIAVSLVAGTAFLPAVPLFRWLLLAVVGMVFSNLMAAQWVGRGYFVASSCLTLGFGALNFAANWALIPRFGATGAAWASVGTYCVGALTNLAFAVWITKGKARSALA